MRLDLYDKEYKERVKKNIHLSTLKSSITFAIKLLSMKLDVLWFEEDDTVIEDYLELLNSLKKIKEE